MGDVLTIIAVTAGAFIGTNLDNLVLLVALYSRFQKQSSMVTAGYFAGMTLIAAVCFVIGEADRFIPLDYLGLLGVIPIVMGVVGLLQLFKGIQDGETASFVTASSPKAVFITVLMTQLSNSADSIITFSVFVVDSSQQGEYLIAPTFFAMVGVFAWLAYFSLNHRKFSRFLARYGHYVTPFILIFVGFYILSNTAYDLAPG
jgi:cadmium resistance protein CadD (predicted permease)